MDELFPLTPIQSQRSGGLSLSLRRTNRQNKTKLPSERTALNEFILPEYDVKPETPIVKKTVNTLQSAEVVKIPLANLPTVRVRSIDDLKAPHPTLDSGANGAKPQSMEISEVIDISSDDDFQESKHNNRRANRKTSTATPRTPIRKTRKKKAMTDVKLEKVTLTRKLTKSTNLKTFSSKYMPASQQSIHKYFNTLDKTDRLGYYETFEKSTVRKTPPPSPPRKKLEPINLNSKFTSNTKLKPMPGTSLVDEETIENMPRLLEYIEECTRHLAGRVEPQQDCEILNNRLSSASSIQHVLDENMQNNIALETKFPNNVSIENQKENISSQSQTDNSGATVSTQKSSSNFGRVRKRLSFKASQEVITIEDVKDAEDVIDLCDSQTPEKKATKDNYQTVVKATARKRTNRRKTRATPIKKERRKKAECPSYKVVENTTFAVDAFRYGEIEGVTHYFLTHFHADHYIGLSKKFTKPVYLSAISARLVMKFLRTKPEYLHIINLEEPVVINGIEVVATDANHCPGAFMFIFKFDTGLCTLHTGDFRACPEMEEGPVFWNYPIHTIYLDTTYLSSRYFFKSQSESMYDAKCAIDEFREKHIGEKVLYVFGSYVIGKERMWATIATEYGLKVWTDENRRNALEAIGNQEYLKHLVDNPHEADMHILTLGNISYDYLNEYMKQFCEFNTIFAIRASGWEKNSKPQYRGRINIVGIAYSEHSSYDELRRFVRFLQPTKIISTVPSGSDVNKTSKIPRSWYENELKSWQKGYQSSITNYISVKDQRKTQASTSSQAIGDENGRRETDSSDDFMAHDCTLTTNATPGQKEAQLAEIINDWLL